jgi:Flp pilus assembly protein TadG
VKRGSRRGAMLILIAILLGVFFVTVAFSVDVAYMQLARTELRTATDASARAAVEALTRMQSEAAGRQAARDIASRNLVAGSPLRLTDADIVFGTSRAQLDGSWRFAAGEQPFNAARVTGRRTNDSPDGSVSLFFSRMLGVYKFQPVQTAVASQLDRDMCLVLDRSGSMAWDLSGVDWSYPPGRSYPAAYCQAPHPALSRWAVVDSAVQVFVDECDRTVQTEQVSLVTYASPGNWCGENKNEADIECRLTSSYRQVRDAVRRVSNNPIPGGTAIGSGIDLGVRTLLESSARPYAVKSIVLMTDGVHNYGRAPIEAARDAARRDIVIHTITFSQGADRAQMQEVAHATGGQSYHAPDRQTLLEIFRKIAATLPIVLTE